LWRTTTAIGERNTTAKPGACSRPRQRQGRTSSTIGEQRIRPKAGRLFPSSGQRDPTPSAANRRRASTSCGSWETIGPAEAGHAARSSRAKRFEREAPQPLTWTVPPSLEQHLNRPRMPRIRPRPISRPASSGLCNPGAPAGHRGVVVEGSSTPSRRPPRLRGLDQPSVVAGRESPVFSPRADERDTGTEAPARPRTSEPSFEPLSTQIVSIPSSERKGAAACRPPAVPVQDGSRRFFIAGVRTYVPPGVAQGRPGRPRPRATPAYRSARPTRGGQARHRARPAASRRNGERRPGPAGRRRAGPRSGVRGACA